MKKLVLLILISILTAFNSFSQGYLKMNKKELRTEHQRIIKQLNIEQLKIDSLISQIKDLDRKYIKEEKARVELETDLSLIKDSLISSIDSVDKLKIELNTNKTYIDSLNKLIEIKDSEILVLNQTNTNINLAKDSIMSKLSSFSDELISLKNSRDSFEISNDSFVNYIKKHMLPGYDDLIYVRGRIECDCIGQGDHVLILDVTEGKLKGQEISIYLQNRVYVEGLSLTSGDDLVHNIQYINFLEDDDEYNYYQDEYSYGIGRPEGSYVSLLVIRNYVYIEDYSDEQNGSSKYDGYYEELQFKPVLVW